MSRLPRKEYEARLESIIRSHNVFVRVNKVPAEKYPIEMVLERRGFTKSFKKAQQLKSILTEMQKANDQRRFEGKPSMTKDELLNFVTRRLWPSTH